MSEFMTIRIVEDDATKIDKYLNGFARHIGEVVAQKPTNPKIECVITYPKGTTELVWSALGEYYHHQHNGDMIDFRAYLLHENGGFHEECASGFDGEPLLIILFKEPIWYDGDIMRTKPNYLLFSNDDMHGCCYPCGVAYYFNKDIF